MAEFQRSVQRRSARVRFVEVGPHDRELTIVLRRDASFTIGELRLLERDGSLRQRNVRFTSCSEAMEGLALIAVVSLDPQALLEPSKPAEPPSVPVPVPIAKPAPVASKTPPKSDPVPAAQPVENAVGPRRRAQRRDACVARAGAGRLAVRRRGRPLAVLVFAAVPSRAQSRRTARVGKRHGRSKLQAHFGYAIGLPAARSRPVSWCCARVRLRAAARFTPGARIPRTYSSAPARMGPSAALSCFWRASPNPWR